MKVTLKRLNSKNHIYFDEKIDELVRINENCLGQGKGYFYFYVKITPEECSNAGLKDVVNKFVEFMQPKNDKHEIIPVVMCCPSLDSDLEVCITDVEKAFNINHDYNDYAFIRISGISAYKDSFNKEISTAYECIKEGTCHEKYGSLNEDKVKININDDDILNESIVKFNWKKKKVIEDNNNNIYDVFDITFKATPHSVKWFYNMPCNRKENGEPNHITISFSSICPGIHDNNISLNVPIVVVKAEMEINKNKPEQAFFNVVFETKNMQSECYRDYKVSEFMLGLAYHVTSISM